MDPQSAPPFLTPLSLPFFAETDNPIMVFRPISYKRQRHHGTLTTEQKQSRSQLHMSERNGSGKPKKYV